jgi:uncharacterized protein
MTFFGGNDVLNRNGLLNGYNQKKEERAIDRPKFIVDQNAGKLVKQLRLLGYDTCFFTGKSDTEMVNTAMAENRIILTRDTHIPERRLVTSGKVKTILIDSDDIEQQIQQVLKEMNLLDETRTFSLCLECNFPLERISKDPVKDRVPPYVLQIQNEYMECHRCGRIYWKGTHWERMKDRLNKLFGETG